MTFKFLRHNFIYLKSNLKSVYNGFNTNICCAIDNRISRLKIRLERIYCFRSSNSGSGKTELFQRKNDNFIRVRMLDLKCATY